MSEAPSEREWRFYLDDMIDFAQRVIEFSHGLDRAGFEASAMTYDATVRNLELMGEAATRVPQSVRDAAAPIPWSQIIATRNSL